ncbi:MAG: hypothetical protein GJ680_15485 [Alteromonadaceae bacterium]|nr:hypothetical protein [Alteromonadaceae bacterium]
MCLVMLYLFASNIHAQSFDEEQERRVRSGLQMFRSILSADKDINKKHNEQQGIDIVFVYDKDLERAQALARRFVRMGRGDKKGKIKDLPITIHIMRNLAGIAQENIQAAGIFILEKVESERIQQTAEYGLQNNIVTYSPYEGDVEMGIMSGLMIATRPKPYFNQATLNGSQIRIKPFMLKVAEIYEPES